MLYLFLLQCSGIETLPFEPRTYETKLGSKFGVVLANVDVLGDSFEELFVGAPLYTGVHSEEGRVYVYTFKDQVHYRLYILANIKCDMDTPYANSLFLFQGQLCSFV